MTTVSTKAIGKVAAVATGLAMTVSLFALAPQARAAALTDSQVQSILTLLSSFGADASTISNVQASLMGGTPTSGSSMGGSMSGSGSVSCSVTTDLTIGSKGAEVTCLQSALISMGYSIPAGATGYFGSQTQAAVAAWQTAKGVMPAAGYFGPKSRAAWSMTSGGGVFTPTPTTPTTPTTPATGLEGGAGSIEDADFVSGLNNEEVGQGEEDVEVAGLEIEADGSDIELAAVTLNFDYADTGGDTDLDDYADEVSVWFDGEEVARLDADEFTDDDNFQKTVSLDAGAIITEGDTGELVVAVSGVKNLDSTNEGEKWNVSFVSVRFRDAQNAVITESTVGDIGETDDDTTTDADEREFSFESFASAADIELKVSNGDDDINDARSIAVDDSDDTDNIEILSFFVEAEGDSDLTIDDLSVDFTSVGAGVGEIINAAEIVVDGDVLDSQSISSTTATTRTVTFDNLDWVLEAGDKVEVIVRVDANDLDGGFTAGDTLMADVNPTDAAWDVEDEEGDTVGNTDKTGSATSEAHSFFADGLQIKKGGNDLTNTKDTNGDTAGGEQGLYTINFDVTAFGNTIYIPTGATIATSSVTGGSGIAYAIENSSGEQVALNDSGLASTTAAVSSSAPKSGSYFRVDEGKTETFTLSVTLTPLADGYFRGQLYGVNFKVGSATTADTLQQATPETDFETTYVDLDA